MLFKNILVPHDGSNHSKHAFKVALDMAKKYNSKITMVSVLSASYTGHWYIDSRIDAQIIRDAEKGVRKDFVKFDSIAKKAKVSFHSKIVKGISAVKTLVSFAKSEKIDLIIMGAHGRTGWDKLILGSVTDGVVHRVRCPVLIVR